MDSAELKIELIHKIIETNDFELLEKLAELLIITNKLGEPATVYQNEEKVYILSDQQISVINKSMEQYKNGKILTEIEAEKDLEKWFEEQEK